MGRDGPTIQILTADAAIYFGVRSFPLPTSFRLSPKLQALSFLPSKATELGAQAAAAHYTAISGDQILFFIYLFIYILFKHSYYDRACASMRNKDLVEGFSTYLTKGFSH